jgi:hypothetical protein
MVDQEGTKQNTETTKDHRGGLIYQQEHGYKLITMIVWLRTPDEQSHVVSREENMDFTEKANYIPSGQPLSLSYLHIAAIDMYHFSAIDGTEIELTISFPSGERQLQAHYTVHANGIEEDSPSIQLDIVRSGESIGDYHIQTHQEYDIPSRLENPPTYPQTIKNISLNEIDHLVKVNADPHFIGSYNVFSGYSKDALGFTAQGTSQLSRVGYKA